MMDILVESIEYYYDEDFSVPFDIGITEENNNTNLNHDYQCENILKYVDITDDEENDQDDYDIDEFERIISPDIFSPNKINNMHNQHKNIKIFNLRHSYDNDFKRPESTQSAVRMSCSSSSSPISSSSMATNNMDKCNPIYIDTQTVSFNESIYSLQSRVPLFNVNNKNILVNYHLHFAPQDSFINSSYVASNCADNGFIETKYKQIINEKHSSSSNLIDSGKYSGTTVDSILQHITEQKPLFPRVTSTNNQSLKPDSILWRQIKFLMNYYYTGWRLLKMFKQFRKKVKTEPCSTDEIVFYRTNNQLKRKQSYSCSVLEMFNSIKDCGKRLENINSKTDEINRLITIIKPIQNFSCQFPPKHRLPNQRNHINSPQRTNNQIYDYPGIGRIGMPKPTRLSSSAFLASNLHSHLSFLQTSLTSHHSDITSNRLHDGDQNSQSPRSLCSLNCQKNRSKNSDAMHTLKPCLRKEDDSDEPKEVICRPKVSKIATDNFKRKSVSFDCPGLLPDNITQEMKEIPKKWGLLGSESRLIGDMMAVFECGRRDSLVGASGLSENGSGHDDATRFRGMVNEVLRAVKQISDRLSVGTTNGIEKPCTLEMNSSFQSQLAILCEMVSNGDGLESPLATAIDNLIALMSDGLVVTSFSNKKVRISSSSANKAAMRLWLLVEETCRNPGNQNTSRKAELAQLLREVRQIITNISSTKDHQLRLRAFIANALKSGLLHVWIRSVVANETALQRFYCPEAFLRQARSGQSDALAALTVSLKALTSTQNSQTSPYTNQTTPITTKPGLPPPVKISRRFFSSPSAEISNKVSTNHSQKPLYSEENTESESCADESRSSQSECPPNRDISNNNNIFSRATHPRTVKKSNSSQLHSTTSDSSRNFPFRSPAKSLTNQNFNSPSKPNVVSISMKTIRTQPIAASRMKPSNKPDKS